ncbi:SAM-dependent methyltransferase [Fodinicola feengrottensis]|uniref:SAM-dependent methyltransferase n=1 Tax=Fodinicola feengrottensis TaxID=435914 RepID=A0ABN2IL45_9ACTN|nr:SAM-dependent methyltransferase [Fodinicola feengrottensis]
MGAEPKIDTTVPSIARVYDYALGGKDHFEVDRAVFNKMIAIDPHMPTVARLHRDWSRKVVRWLAESAGVDQFLDCGSGLPTMDNTHEVAQRANPDALVVYVDNDPTVVAHGRALLEDNDRTVFAAADLRKPDELFAHDKIRGFLDLDRPIGMIQGSTLHHIDKLSDQQSLMARYLGYLPSGSYVALTHVHNPHDDSELDRMTTAIEEAYRTTNATTHFRPYEEIVTLFDGLEFVEPGLVQLHRWWPGGPLTGSEPTIYGMVLGGVARKP